MNQSPTGQNYTSISMSSEIGTCYVQVYRTEMRIGDVIDDLIIPVLRGMGYSEILIDVALKGKEDPLLNNELARYAKGRDE